MACRVRVKRRALRRTCEHTHRVRCVRLLRLLPLCPASFFLYLFILNERPTILILPRVGEAVTQRATALFRYPAFYPIRSVNNATLSWKASKLARLHAAPVNSNL